MGKLYVVGTPIGNLEDITLRALRILKEVNIIAAEDTRHSKKLLTHYEIRTPLTSYHDYNKEEKSEILLQKLKDGNTIALLCDAGTPTICDPGFYIIRKTIQSRIPVIPIPGPTALISGLSISALPPDRFIFEGFPPRKHGARQRWLESLQLEKRTIIFYESPHRIIGCLTDLKDLLGDRNIVLAREITKTYEEFLRGKTSDVLLELEKKTIRGEITIIVEGGNIPKKKKNRYENP